MAKIFSILTLLIAGLAIWLGMENQKQVKALQDAGDKLKSKIVKTEDVLKSTEAELAKTKAELEATKATLETTRAELQTTKTNLEKMTADYTAAKTELDAAKGQIAEINKILVELFPGTDIKPDDLKGAIEKLKTSITDLTNKNKDLEGKVANLEKDKASLEAAVAVLEQTKKENDGTIAKQGVKINRWEKNFMEKGVRGRVMAVNSGWGFCVVSIGDKQGAAANKIMIVARNGQAIGKVKITNVESSQSVADILSGTFVRNTYVQPGDDVIFTGDDKVKTDDVDAGLATPPPAIAPPALPTNP